MKHPIALWTLAVVSTVLLAACTAPAAQNVTNASQQAKPAREQAGAVTIAGPLALRLDSVDFLSPATGYVTGATMNGYHVAGRFLWKTTNTGVTWSKRATPVTFDQVHFVSETTGFAIHVVSTSSTTSAAKVELWRTVNGGLTWSKQLTALQSPMVAPSAYTIAFPDHSHGYALVGNALYDTRDGGASWHEVPMPSDKSFPVAFAFATPQRGWIVDETLEQTSNAPGAVPHEIMQIYATSNGGATWKTQPLMLQSPYTSYGSASLSFVSPKDGFFFVQNTSNMISSLYRTTDAGQTWSAVAPKVFQSRFMPRPIDFVSKTVGWLPVNAGAAPFPGLIDITTDGGKTFHTYGNQNTSIWSTDLVAATDGWAIGQYQGNVGDYLIHTTDGGATWTQAMPTPYPLTAPSFVSSLVGYGIGTLSDPSAFVRTEDGGRTWQQIAELHTPLSASVGALSFVSASKGYYLFTSGAVPQLYMTSDSGRTWQSVPLSWKQVPAASTHLWDPQYLHYFSSTNAIAVVQTFPSLVVMQSKDGGRKWTPFATLSTRQGGFTDIVCFASEADGYAVLGSGKHVMLYHLTPGHSDLVKTWDNGATPVALSVNPVSGITLVMNNNAFTGAVLTIARKTPQQSTWTQTVITNQALANSTTPLGAAISSYGPDLWWLTASGLLYSKDGGASWQSLNM